MKAFKECNKRYEGKCVHRGFKCKLGQEIEVGECWRMCKEGVMFLQCPVCESELWFDIETNGPGTGSIFFCPTCNKDVSLAVAVQTRELLNEKLKENQKVLAEYKKLSLTPRGFDVLDRVKKEDERIKAMIANFREIN